MYVVPEVRHPYGISVFGSALTRVEPDIVSVTFVTSRLEQHPRDAFRETRLVTQTVRAYLEKCGAKEYGSSRILLEHTTDLFAKGGDFIGYTASAEFQLILRDLDSVEDILSGLVDAGVNEIRSMEFQTSRLRELRAEVRQKAVHAAFEKAEVYCRAAKVSLGRVVHIEDVNPDAAMNRRRSSHSHFKEDQQPYDDGQLRAFNPASIVVGGAVVVAFELQGT